MTFPPAFSIIFSAEAENHFAGKKSKHSTANIKAGESNEYNLTFSNDKVFFDDEVDNLEAVDNFQDVSVISISASESSDGDAEAT